MCCLFGIVDHRSYFSVKEKNHILSVLSAECEERGTDATGIAYCSHDHLSIYKRPLEAHRMHFHIPEDSQVIMGHTRMTTQGNEKFNYNNHPFYGHADIDFAFAHNGVLHNDKELRKEKNLPQTKIETDSYVAVQLIEQQRKLDLNSLKSMAEDVHGSFCFTVLDENNNLYIVKGNNPMHLIHFEELGIYVYTSTESIMKKALKKAGFNKSKFELLNVEEGDILKTDQNGTISCSEFEVKESFSYGKYFNWYDNFENEYSQQEEILLEMCGCYGVTEDDVLLLLDYGYSAEEVEDMLCDTTCLRDAICTTHCEDTFYCK